MTQSNEDRKTVTVDQAADLLGVARNSAYAAIKKDGALAGVGAIYVGKRILLPREPLEAALGMRPGE